MWSLGQMLLIFTKIAGDSILQNNIISC